MDMSEIKTATEITFPIVSGHFAADSAEKIVSGLLQVKIEHHKSRMHDLPELYEESISHSEQKIKAVEENLRRALEFIREAAAQDRLLDMEGHITIRFAEQ
jgi:hypothetical protein